MIDQARPASLCPICRKPQIESYRPFCSRRCADIDLSRWLKGVYAIPATARDEDETPLGQAEGEGVEKDGDG